MPLKTYLLSDKDYDDEAVIHCMAKAESERHDDDQPGSENTLVIGTGFIIGNEENYGAHILC